MDAAVTGGWMAEAAAARSLVNGTDQLQYGRINPA